MNAADSLALDNCQRCSLCVTYCPVARVSNKYTGPKQNGPDLKRFSLEDDTIIHPSVGYCSNCKSCDVACPSGVNISKMIIQSKGKLVEQQGAPLRDQILSRVDILGKVCSIAPGVVNWAGRNRILRKFGRKVFAVSEEMPFPSYAREAFQQVYRSINQRGAKKRKVLYYPGCYVTYNAPEVGLAAIDVLQQNGVEVLVDDFECCGLPLVANGLLKVAEKRARNNVKKLEKCLKQDIQIVTSCPSCNLTLKNEYDELFAMGKELGLKDRVVDVFEYLQILRQEEELNTQFSKLNMKLGYHQPCHLRASGCGIPSADILRLVPGLSVLDLDAGCCGGSGTYSFKLEKYDISQEIGKELVRAIEEAAVDRVLTECGMCQLQIEHMTGLRVFHPIQLISHSYGKTGAVDP